MIDEDSRVKEAYCSKCKHETTQVFDDIYTGGFGNKYKTYKCTECDEHTFEELLTEKKK